MKPRFSASLGLLLYALVSTILVGSLAAADAAQQVSTGSYVFEPTPVCGGCEPGGRNRFEAHGPGGLLATGSFDFTDLIGVTGTEVTGTVDCLTVTGNLAALHGVVVSSTPPSLYAPGSSIVWRVISSRGKTPDQSSVPQSGSVGCCIGGFFACNPPTFNASNGNIFVMSW